MIKKKKFPLKIAGRSKSPVKAQGKAAGKTQTLKSPKKSLPKGKSKSTRAVNLGNKIKGLAKQTQKSVQDQFFNQTEALKTKLSSYGIGVDDVKAKAKQLEGVLKDLRSREFLKQPGVQNLVERVTRKSVEKSNQEALKSAEVIPRQKKLSQKQKQKQEEQFSVLTEKSNQQVGSAVVKAIMKRVEEVRRTFTSTTASTIDSIRRKK